LYNRIMMLVQVHWAVHGVTSVRSGIFVNTTVRTWNLGG